MTTKPVYILELSPKQFSYIATQVVLAETELPLPEFDNEADLDEYTQVKAQVKAILDQARVQLKFDELRESSEAKS